MAWPYDQIGMAPQQPDPLQAGDIMRVLGSEAQVMHPDEMLEFNPPQVPLPDDFASRLALAGVQFGHPGRITSQTPGGGLAALLGLASAFGNYKVGRARRKISDVDQKNLDLREAAQRLANRRHQARIQDKQLAATQANLESNQALRRDLAAQRLEEAEARRIAMQDAADERNRQRTLDRELRAALAKATIGGRGAAIVNTIVDNVKNDPDINGFIAIRDSHGIAAQASQQGDSEGDLILMRMAAKMTDPTTGVREEEFRTFETAQGSLARAGVKLTADMIGQGKLTPIGRSRLMNTIQGIYDRKLNRYIKARSFFENMASDAGLDPKRVVRDYAEQDSAATKPRETWGLDAKGNPVRIK